MRLLRWFVVVVLLFCIVPLAAAQDLTETFVSADETYTVAYPEDFEATEEGAIASFVGRIGRESIVITIASPAVVTQLVAETAGRRLDTKLENILTDLGYEITESDVVEFGDVELAYALIAPTADDLQGAGYLKPLSDGESFGLMIALNDRNEFSEDAQSIIGGMLSTYDLYNPSGGGTGGGTERGGELPASLRDFDGRAEEALAELQDAGIVEDGEIIAEERRVTLQGNEVQTLDVGPGDDVANFVMAFEINFTSENAREYETCSMVARYMTDRNDNAQFLEFGVNNEDEALVFDLFGPNEGESTYVAVAEGIDLADPQHFLVLVSGGQAVVYLNGSLVADNVPVADHEGIFFLLLRGKDPDTVCQARNLWIFQADGELNLGGGDSTNNSSGGGGGSSSGDCIVIANSNVNQRSGPGTNFNRAGFLNKGEEAVAIAVAEDRDGALWFQLEDETWVRADVVTTEGDCDNLPEGG